MPQGHWPYIQITSQGRQTMTKTFSRFINRKDRQLTGFSATDTTEQSELLRAISCNSTTGYVRQLVPGGAVSVTNHAADAVEAHLVKCGWSRG